MEREEGYGLKSSTSITGKDHSLETGVTRFHNVFGPWVPTRAARRSVSSG